MDSPDDIFRYRIERRERLGPGRVRYHGTEKATGAAFYVDVRTHQRGDDIEVTQVAKFRWASGLDDPDYPRDEVYDAMVGYARDRGWLTVHAMDRLHLPGNWIWDDYVEESGE